MKTPGWGRARGPTRRTVPRSQFPEAGEFPGGRGSPRGSRPGAHWTEASKAQANPSTHWEEAGPFQPDEVKWALESITTNKASGGDGIPVELFQLLKDDAVKVLYSICQQIWKTQQWPQD